MSTATAPLPELELGVREIVSIWGRHLLSLLFPFSALAFLWTGPHPWYVAPIFAVPVGVAFFYDNRAPERQRVELRQPADALPAWPFDALVYLLAFLQLVVLVELARMFSQQVVFSVDMAMVFIMVGANSGFSIITAHELIHRKPWWEQQLGRLLLCTVLYEHFYTEHLRGHHVRVGTDDDPATARFPETYREFWKRTVPAQFKSAWRLECRRLGDTNMSLFDRRMLRNRILHGIAVGWGMAFAVLFVWGYVAFFAYLLQAFVAVRLLEAVNYFEHWGLRRRGRRVQPQDSWDTHSWITYYGLTGLSRHADHHANPARPYQQLRVFEEAPVLPVGYIALVDMVMARNNDFIALATSQLKERGLGPFADAETPEEVAALEARANEVVSRPPWPRRVFGKAPGWVPALLVAAGVVLALTLGGHLEAGGGPGFTGRLALNGWILAVFAGALLMRARLVARWQSEALSWGAAFALLIVIGRFTEIVVGAS